MHGILKVFTLVVLLSAARSASAQAEWFEGIWQEQREGGTYFSLHIEGDQVVLVDLGALERTGRTLAASYRGQLGVSRTGTPMATVRVIEVNPGSQGSADILVNADRTLRIYWCYQPAGGCVVGVVSTIRKVF